MYIHPCLKESALNLQIICIDIQNDFTHPQGVMCVPKGPENAKRTAAMIKRLTQKISDIHVTLDSHEVIDIAHPLWWINDSGDAPPPYTGISLADFRAGKWRTRQANARQRTLKYLETLESSGRYQHTVWPEHCRIARWGHNLNEDVIDAVDYWERTRYATANKVTKGSNQWTEHFSAVRAEVPDPEDPTTQLNRPLIQTFKTADMLVWTGEALSHCMANTFRDTVEAFSDPSLIGKMWLLTDTTSNVQGYEHLGEAFLREMTAKGLNLSTSVDFLK